MIRTAMWFLLAGLSVGLLSGADDPGKSKPPVIKVSRETTYLLEPLDAAGYVDYVEAVNQRASKGVTPATNFEVAFRAALGPQSILESIRTEYFKRLGVKAPEDAPYYQDFIAFHSAVKDAPPDDVLEEQGLLMSQPWSDTEHPRGAAWLKAIGPRLDQIVEGTRLPRMYSPYLAGNDPTQARLILAALPAIGDHRSLARSLLIRAYSRMAKGDLDGAWSDIQAIHRQARLISQGSFSIELLVGIALDSLACNGDASILQSGKLTKEQVRRYLTDLDKLAPLPPMAEAIDKGERLVTLDAVHSLARSNGKSLKSIVETEVPGSSALIALDVDWNATLKYINQEYVEPFVPMCGKKMASRVVERLANIVKQLLAVRHRWSLQQFPHDTCRPRINEALRPAVGVVDETRVVEGGMALIEVVGVANRRDGAIVEPCHCFTNARESVDLCETCCPAAVKQCDWRIAFDRSDRRD